MADIRCGGASLFSTAVSGVADGGLVREIRTAGRNDRAAGKGGEPLVSAQFNGDPSVLMTGGDVMASSGAGGVEEHPAKRIAAPTTMAAGLYTGSLCAG